MFVVWAYLYVMYWDLRGSCTVREGILKHFVAQQCSLKRDRLRDVPEQKPSTYG